MPSVDVTSDIAINRQIADLAAFAANPDNAPVWYKNIKSVEWKTPPPLEVGSRIAFVAHFLGRQLSYTYEIIDFAPLEKLVMRTSEGPFPMETSYAWTSVDSSRTRMTLRNRGSATGFSLLVAPLMQFAIRRENRKDLIRLKDLLESEGDKLQPVRG